ncbi:MAG TPA: Ig-like domain-containing protein, partial [Thermoanaerobaculia bacterium]|nr:Ig-like domain-containing protein [Thermoanaerobaculia bacterium]
HFSPISPITVMRSDGTNNTSGHIVERFITEIILNDKYFYTWRYTQGMKHNRMQVSLQDAWPGDTAVYEFLDVPKTYSVETPGWSQAQDESDLFAGPGHRYYYRQGSLFLKMLASGATWHAMDVVDLCMTGPGCSPGLLTLPPLPSVQITSPLDGERVASGSTVTVNVDASIAAPNNIRAAYLYVGTDILGADRIAPYSFTLTGLPDGAYPLKVVVEASNNQSYTAVQQLFVGEPGPRVEITNLADNQTYPASQPLTVAFNVYNWTVSPNGSHLQLVIDDLDGGPLYTAAPVVLSNLSQGEHEIEIALAEASGKVTAVTDRVKIYIAANQVLADFEDGIDSRTTLTADDPNVGVTPIGFAWGTADAVASRADGEDDINWYDIVLDGAPYGFATWRLKLDPAESWVGWTKLEITTDGIPFEAIVTDAQQGDTSLGMRTGTVTVLNLPTNSTLIDQVVALKLHYDESILSSNPARQHLRKIRLLP